MVLSHEVMHRWPPEAHVIEFARGGVVHHIELYGLNFTPYFSELGSIFKKAIHLKPLNSRLPCFAARLEIKRSHLQNHFVTDGHTDTQKK